MVWMDPGLLSLEVGDGRAVAGVSRAIQLSVAPVFLFTGVTGLLSLFTSRLARIIDRSRVIQEALANSLHKGESDRQEAERLEQVLVVQRRRTFLINRAILSVTLTALLVAAVVAVLFISAVAALDVATIVVPLFVAAMGAMIVGLLLFLLEVQLAIRQNPRRYY
ncbi:MAG: histidine kinase [Cyanobium sp. CACIAM 14]|nr:MAG: histidine kinase [Cyanobium sp. CACIAM 14]